MKLRHFIFLVFLSQINVAYSCICNRPKPIEEYAKSVDEIFIGVATNQECTFTIDSITGEAYADNYITTFEVLKKFKGNNNKFLYLSQGNSTCDYYFQLGNGLQLIFAYNHEFSGKQHESKSKQLLISSVCLPNKKLFSRYDIELKKKPKNIQAFKIIDELEILFPEKVDLINNTKTKEHNFFLYISIFLALIVIAIVVKRLIK
ncbi:MAG: hypothetical protein OQJ96_11695 [Flavobacteriales bacterium]|nr:hypothetical protein [Flavobacteriales bacterium]MCW8912985.1 hypothetical protein [Flavobacteriales bacterium]MCW8938993.1 hypothetical protein [Flavobacteriales bacterium]MCW8940713.1 hypothetical protein [Flavobacteriales bacterium]MCW8969172.1 hypothetical protein [Flavobacteriales bacterium]